MKIGISGATIIDSTGMGRTLICNDDIPIFGGLRKLFDNCRPYNKTIFSVIESEDVLQSAIEAIKEEVGTLDAAGSGILFTIPVNHVMGLTQNSDEKDTQIKGDD